MTSPLRPRRAPNHYDPSQSTPDVPYGSSIRFDDAMKSQFQTPTLVDKDGKLLLVPVWASKLKGDGQDVAMQVARAMEHGDGGVYKYMGAHAIDEVRQTNNEGLAAGGGDCAWFSSIAVEALIASGRFTKDTAMVVGFYGVGGFHTVATFLNPRTGKWDVMDYTHVAHPGANTPSAAVAAYSGNPERAVFYWRLDPNGKPQIAYRMIAEHPAQLTKMFGQPGVGPKRYGMQPGLNETVIPKQGDVKSPMFKNGQGLSTNGATLTVGPASAAVQLRPDGAFDNATLAVDERSKDGKVYGGKGMISSDPAGGTNIFIGGEWWTFSPNAYFGVVGGAEARVNTESVRLKGDKETSIAPIVGIQGGTRMDFYGSAEDSFQVSGYWNGALRIGAPFVINEEARARVDHGANGNGPGGIIDPSVLGMADVHANTGLAMRWRFAPRFEWYNNLTLRADIMDPTLLTSPLDYLGLTFDSHLSFEGEGFDATVGAQAQKGLYDRDPVWMGYGSLGAQATKDIVVGATVSGGEYLNGTAFGQGAAGLTYTRNNDRGELQMRISAGAGATVEHNDNGTTTVAPTIGIQAKF